MRWRSRAGVALAAVCLSLAGCVYLNTLYNAREALDAGDRARLAGYARQADSAYRVALDKARASWEADSLGRWGDLGLLVRGQATLRLGDPESSQRLLGRLLERAEDPDLRARAQLYRGAALGETGRYEEAVQALNASLFGLAEESLRAEAHLWRGRVLLALGVPDQAFWDLGQARALDDRFLTPAALERLAWAIPAHEPAVAATALAALQRHRPAGSWADSVTILLAVAEERWGPVPAAELARDGELAWAPGPRDAFRLYRAALLGRAGRDRPARTAWGRIVEDDGPGAVTARVELSRWVLRQGRDLAALDTAGRILDPLVDDTVPPLLHSIRAVGLLADRGLRPGAAPRFASLFLAGERARDDLAAPGLAGTLFLAAAAAADGGPWRGKALLAAAALDPDRLLDSGPLSARYRTLLRGGDPYVVRARNRYLATDTLATLDAVLQDRMDAADRRVQDQLRRLSAAGGNGP